MLLVQDVHIVRGREELPFEDTYRNDLGPALADHGARLAFFGWAPHGGGQGYEALVLTAVDGTAALRTYQEAIAHGALADTWRTLEAADHSLHSTLLVPTDRGFDVPSLPESEPEGPRPLFRHDTLTVSGSAVATADALDPMVGAAADDDLLEVLGCFSPAAGELATPEVVVFSRIGSFERLRGALGELAGGPWRGTATADAVLARTVRISRCASWSPIQ
jgi:hypothetical protein